MFFNINLTGLSDKDLEAKIFELQDKMTIIHASGRADIYNQMVSTLSHYLTEYNNRKTKKTPNKSGSCGL